jgi:hypothetical protein
MVLLGASRFEFGVGRRVDDGEDNLFWNDHGLVGGVMRVRFRHLFYLFVGNDISVVEMCRLNWGRGLREIGGDGGDNCLCGRRDSTK